jgi:site-specific recombinase XerD
MKTSSSATVLNENQSLSRAGECLYRSDVSGIYYGIFKRGGKQVKRSLKTSDKELAKRRLEDLRQKVGRLNTKTGNVLFPDVAKRFLEVASGRLKASTIERMGSAVKSLSRHFPNTVRGITQTQVESWSVQRCKERSGRTFNIERDILVQILNCAVRDGIILDNPALCVPRRKQRKSQVVIPTRQQFRKLLAQMRQDVRAEYGANLCEFLAYSGCRLGEATAMRWGDVNFELGCFTVTGGELGTKNHEARTVPLFAPLSRLLATMREASFPAPMPGDLIFTIAKTRRALASACRRAKLPHFTHHSLRHFFCSNAIESGIDFKVIAGWLGHKDGGVLVAKTYGHLRDEHSAAMAKRMTFDAACDDVPSNVVKLQARS